MAYDSANQRFLVTWEDYRSGTNYDIYGQFVRASDGALFNHGNPGNPYNPVGGAGANFVISNAAAWKINSTVAYDSVNQRFLVVWEDQRAGEFHAYGQFVRASDGALFNHGNPGNPYNPAGSADGNFAISNATGSRHYLSVAFGSANQQFLVAWTDTRSGNNDIYGQFVRASDGALFNHAQPGNPYNPAGSANANFVVCNATNQQSSASVAYDGYKQRFLVAWEDYRSGTNYDIYGQLIRASDGALFNHAQPGNPYDLAGSADVNFVISNAANDQYAPSVAFDSANQRFLAAWARASSVIFGQLINADGSLYDTASNVNFLIAADAISNNPAAVFNPACGNFLTIFETTVSGVYDVGLAVVGPPCCTPPPSGMAAWWGGDNNALDMVGNNNGTLNGATYAAGKVGQAFSLDGVNDYVEMTGSSVGDFGSAPFTVDFWMYASSDPTSNAYLVGKSCPSCGEGWDLRFDNNTISVYGVNGWALNFWSDPSVTVGAWHHIALVSTASLATLYIDGVAKGNSTRAAISSTSSPFSIGYNPNYGGVAFNGLIDEVEIFNRALSVSEINAIYNAGSTGKCRSCTPPPSGMISWWQGEDNAADSVGTNNGTLTNGTTFGNGKVGRAFSLDGIDDFISVPDSPALRFTNAVTAEAWFKMDNATALFGVLISKGDTSWRLQRNHMDQNTLLFGTNPAYHNLTGTRNVNDGQWHHAAAVFDGTTKYLYVDGSLDASVSWMNTIDQTTDPVWIGNNSAFPDRLWKGLIDEVGVYNRALSASEISAIYNAGSEGKCFVSHNVNATSPGGNGTLSCTGPVLEGYDSTCTITPATGYYLSALTDNTVDKLGSVVGGTYTMSNVTATHDVVATFAEYEIKRVSGSDYYYNLLSEAFGAVADTDIVMLRQGGLAAGEYNRPGVSITLRGGYDSGFGSNTGPATTLTGLLTIRAGSMTVEKIVIN